MIVLIFSFRYENEKKKAPVKKKEPKQNPIVEVPTEAGQKRKRTALNNIPVTTMNTSPFLAQGQSLGGYTGMMPSMMSSVAQPMGGGGVAPGGSHASAGEVNIEFKPNMPMTSTRTSKKKVSKRKKRATKKYNKKKTGSKKSKKSKNSGKPEKKKRRIEE